MDTFNKLCSANPLVGRWSNREIYKQVSDYNYCESYIFGLDGTVDWYFTETSAPELHETHTYEIVGDKLYIIVEKYQIKETITFKLLDNKLHLYFSDTNSLSIYSKEPS